MQQKTVVKPLATEMWAIDRIVPYARNPRSNDGAVERMVAAIREFGFKIPLLVLSTGELIDGHLRLKAAKKLNLDEVPVIACDEWTPAQVKSFRLLINRSATWADWDEQLLALEIGELQALEFDLSFTGFAPIEIDSLLSGTHATDADADRTPVLPQQPVTILGDVWTLDQHRVLCGDATSAADVTRLLGAKQPPLMVTDPPYGVHYDPQWREQAGLGQLRQTGGVPNDDRVDWTAAFDLFPGDVAYVWHAGVYADEVAQKLRASDWEIRAQIIWGKQHFALSRGHYHWQHEPCWYAVRKARSSHWRGDRTQSTLWQVANLNPFGGAEETPTGHSTQKPVELMRRPILNHTERGEVVYDPFLGSGTAMIAAEVTGRICCGVEIEPVYVDVAVLRWQTLTGKSARLEGDGRTFTEVQAARAAAMRTRRPAEDGAEEAACPDRS